MSWKSIKVQTLRPKSRSKSAMRKRRVRKKKRRRRRKRKMRKKRKSTTHIRILLTRLSRMATDLAKMRMTTAWFFFLPSLTRTLRSLSQTLRPSLRRKRKRKRSAQSCTGVTILRPLCLVSLSTGQTMEKVSQSERGAAVLLELEWV